MGAWIDGDMTALAALLAGAAGAAWLGIPGGFPTLGAAERPAAASPALALDGVAFQASSLGTWEELEGDFGGRVAYRDGAVSVALPVSRVVTPYGALAGTRLMTVGLGLVEWGPDGWRVVRTGTPHRVDADLVEQPELWLRDLTLEIPGLLEEDLLDRSLVVIQELRVPDEAGGWQTRTLYAHADRETLNRLLGWWGDGNCTC